MPDAFSQAARYLAPKQNADPVSWVYDRLGWELVSYQREIMESVRDNHRTAVRSCHAAGKSHVAALVACWWIDSHEPGEAFVVTTAPTFPQVRAILWRYMRRIYVAGKLPGNMNQTEWSIGKELVAYGRKPADYQDSGFQGIHAPKVLVILDEACGIMPNLYVAAETITTTNDCRILAIGNPDIPGGAFEEAHNSENWNSIRVSAYDTPRFTGENVSPDVANQLIDPIWVEQMKGEWGEDSPLFQSKILAEFPKDAPDAIVRASDVARCRIGRDLPYGPGELLPVELGVDVGGGGDPTVIRERRGPVAGRVWRLKSDRPEEIAPLVRKCIQQTGATSVKIDSGGIGWGLVGELRNIDALGCNVVPVNAGSTPSHLRFLNTRAEMWWLARTLSESGQWDLSGIDDSTAAQLCSPRYFLNQQNKIQVEKKDEIRARIKRSPDDADALILAYFSPDVLNLDEWFAVRNGGQTEVFTPESGCLTSNVLYPFASRG